MTALQAIRETLISIGVPVQLAPYEGDEESTYIVYKANEEHGDDFGDDDAETNITECEVSLCCPLDESPSELSRQLRRLIASKECFTYPRMISDYDPQQRRTLWIYTFQYDGTGV